MTYNSISYIFGYTYETLQGIYDWLVPKEVNETVEDMIKNYHVQKNTQVLDELKENYKKQQQIKNPFDNRLSQSVFM